MPGVVIIDTARFLNIPLKISLKKFAVELHNRMSKKIFKLRDKNQFIFLINRSNRTDRFLIEMESGTQRNIIN